MRITLIAAVSVNGVIGDQGKLPWHIPEDLKHFKEKTMDKVIIMGRKTFDSIGKPLPGRTNVILTMNEEYKAPRGVEVYHDIQDALYEHYQEDEIMVIGGEQIYTSFLKYANKIILTEVSQVVDGDAYFPEFKEGFEEVSRESHDGYDFVEYQRIEQEVEMEDDDWEYDIETDK